MKLLPLELAKKIPGIKGQENIKDPIVWVRFFCPWNHWTWYAYEFDGKDLFFGYVMGFENEFGYFSLRELESVKGPFGLFIERDLFFTPKKLSLVLKNAKKKG